MQAFRRSNTESSQAWDTKSFMSSTSSLESWTPPAPRTTHKPEKRKVRTQSQTFSDCGRHSNQWLFNNRSITNTIKKIFER